MRKFIFTILILAFMIAAPKIWAVEYTVSNLRNPFDSLLPTEARKVKGGEALPALTISGLVWGSEKPEAIINGSVVKVGDEVQGVKILEISKEGVTVLFEGRSYKIRPQKTLGQ